MRKHAKPRHRTNGGYILPSLVLSFALMISIFAYNNYYKGNQNAPDAEVAVNSAPTPAQAGSHEEQTRRAEQWQSLTRSDLELRLDELEKQFSEYSETADNNRQGVTHTDYQDDELSAHLEEWQASVNRQLGMMQDGFTATVESLEARISNSYSSSDHAPTNMATPAHNDQLELRINMLDQRLAQITDTYTSRLDLLENSLEHLAASRHESPHDNINPVQTADQTQLHLLMDQFDQASEKYDARIRELEMRLTESGLSSSKTLDKIEKSLVTTAERLEALTSMVASMSDMDNSATIRIANETLETEPPAAAPGDPQPISQGSEPGIIHNEKPGPAAHENSSSQNISSQIRPATVYSWSVNLASYSRESIADVKLDDFRKKGVAAEKLAKTVDGKIMYRLRVTGFDDIESAKSSIPEIKQILGLKEVWISRN